PLTRSCRANAISPLTALPCRLFIDIPSQAAKEWIVDDFLVERGILSAAFLPRILHKKLALRNAGCAEGVRLDDVRTCLQKPTMDVTDHLWLGQGEEVTVVQQALGRTLEALSADVCLRHAIRADRRAHRSVDDRNST